MCARTTLTKPTLEDIAAELEAEFSPEDLALYRPRYNVAPSDRTWIVEYAADSRRLVPAVWGYVARDKPLINIRGEQVASGRGFRDAFAGRRCAVVTDGFFEWDRRKQPTWFHRGDGRLLLLAGLFQPSAVPQESRDAGRPRFTVLTTRPNALVAKVHDRMPVIVSAAALDDWLTADPVQAARLIAPAADGVLLATPVSTRVNSVRNDDADCLIPVDRPLDDPQKSLF
jgi:putative SOS response-associated peptidase YedK